MKKTRQQKIIEIIENRAIETQEELAEALKAEGYEVTQSTVSRDIRQLKLTKVTSSEGKQRYSVVPKEKADLGDRYIRVFREGFVSMEEAQNILVIRTVSGMAMAVAAAIDAMQFPEVVGCIAGDDTIMAAIKTVEDTYGIMEKLRQYLE